MAFQDAAGFQNNNGTFNNLHDPSATVGMLDSSSPFMQNSNAFDLGQFQAPPLQQRIQNGIQRNASPAFHNPVYQVNPVVPSKRPRPREDSLGASPRQAAGMLPASRSQTPQQPPYQNFQGNQRGGPGFSVPTPFQHLPQVASANASPSPVMQNQQFRPPGVPQRVQTASPGPFSPAGQHFGAQMATPQADHGGRVHTPQNNTPGFGQNLPYNSAYNQQQFVTPPVMSSAVTQPGLSAPHVQLSQNLQQQQQNAQRMYQMRLQQHQQQLQGNNFAHTRQASGSFPGMPNQPPHQNFGSGRPDKVPQQTRPNSQDQFMKGLISFMHQRGLPLNTNPMIGDRSIGLVQLYAVVLRHGGSKNVTKTGGWSSVATTLQLPLAQYPLAAQELQDHYEKNLAAYEAFWMQMQQRQKATGNQNNPQQYQGGQMPGMPGQMSPSKQLNGPAHEANMQSFLQQTPQSTPMKPSTTPETGIANHSALNGYLTPQQNHNQGSAMDSHDRQPRSYPAGKSNLSQRPGGNSPNTQNLGSLTSGQMAQNKANNMMPSPSSQAGQDRMHSTSADKPPETDPLFRPKSRTLDTHGGLDMRIVSNLGAELAHSKPNVPAFMEMGVIDIHALTMSLRSGIHAEVRLALDTLAILSVEPRFQLSLESCEDLVETLISCAEEQVEVLAENAAEVFDDIVISPYEDVLRGCRGEVQMIQDTPVVGTLEYDLDRAVERVVCITTVLRNLSFYETNHALLADSTVVKFLSTVIRYLGTRNMLLRTHTNTLDFMKDIVIYLSNLSQAIELQGKEDALCLLQFLLSFAPSPPPMASGDGKIMFAPYQPSIHRYLPPAVDSLAKLLARDEPNRIYYKSIFLLDASSSPSFELLTRAFALAIAPLPDHRLGPSMVIVEARKPYLIQGLLAAEILATLMPASESELAHSWLSSEDGFASSLLRLVYLLSTDSSASHLRQAPGSRTQDHDIPSYQTITNRGISVLRRLAEKAQSNETPKSVPSNILPKMENLLGALLASHLDSNVVRQLCAYAGLKL